MKKLLLSFLMMALPLLANAYNAEIDGIYYDFSGDEATVTSGSPKYSGSVVIPYTVTYSGKTYTVTSIGDWAFRDCTSLTSITIPESVTNIDYSAFRGCTSLTSITIPGRVTSIGDYAFYNCSSLTSITIPNSVTSIGNSAFQSCSSLTSITIPNSVTSIGSSAFYNCSSLTSITIPNSVTSIGDAAFRYCTSLTSITIPNSVTSIGNYAFYYCSSLTSITIPNSVTSIGNSAFSSCSSLTSITIPNSVTSIGFSAFEACAGLTSVTIPNNVARIGNGAFSCCSGLISIKVEEGNSNYDSRDNCNAIIATATNTLISGCLNTVIPERVTSIGPYAFTGYSGLTSVTIPNSVTSIGFSAFEACAGLTSVTIPNSVTNIYRYAFRGCGGLKDFYCYAEEIPQTDNEAFADSPIGSSTLHVPAGSVDAYKAKDPWSGFGSIVAIPSPTYTLTYMVDGETYNTVQYEEGESITPEEAPTKEGSTFSGWEGLPETMPANDVVVTGSFTINSYTLTYMVDGEEYKTTTVVYGSEIVSEEEPSKEGYTFSGWSEIPTTMPAHDVTITGSFIINQYTITFDTDAGSQIGSITQDYNSTITPPENPTKTGYTFLGWEPALPETMPAYNLTVKAQWQINSYVLVYYVDGVEYSRSEVEYGTEITSLEEPTKEGYTFSGWSEIPETMPAHEVEVTGSFTINSYTLTYKVDGEVYETYEVEFGAAINPETEPTKEGYTFSGWSEIPETMPAHDVTVTGTFTKIIIKCATPNISYANGELKFDCETEGVEFKYDIDIEDNNIKSGISDKVQLSVTYHITVYATKEDYYDSEVATGTLCWIDQQPQTEGIVAEDAVTEVKALPVLIQSHGGTITVQGANEGTEISVYSVNGMKQGSAIATQGLATIETSLRAGSVAVVKIGDKAVKVLIK